MKFSLIVCTYMRSEPLLRLLQSVKDQSQYPNEILIIDGSIDNKTKKILNENRFNSLRYFSVSDQDRGLTKQRNFGISKVDHNSEIVCFLDDDIVLEFDYFENLIKAYKIYPEALGIGGYIKNNNAKWSLDLKEEPIKYYYFYFDGWRRK